MTTLVKSFFALVLGICPLCDSGVSAQKTKNNPTPITVDQLGRRKVTGKLGHPLGAIVTIEGQAADDTYTREKADAGRTLLRIESVNGKQLRREVVFPFVVIETVSIATPSVGTRFKFVGFETGEFIGMPDGVFKYVEPFATTGYYFRSSFVVISNALKKP
jgi:hypothetical protein